MPIAAFVPDTADQPVRERRNFTKATVRRDVEHGVAVAVKSLRGRSVFARFGPAGMLLRREARMLARLDGLGCVPRLLRAEHDEIAVSWAEGRTLRSPGSPGITSREADLVRQALVRFHAAGWAHGDLGPRDVVVSETDAKILDLATCVGPGAPPLVGGFLVRFVRAIDRRRVERVLQRGRRLLLRSTLLQLAAERQDGRVT